MKLIDQKWTLPAAYLKVFLQHAAKAGLQLEPLLEGTKLQAEGLLESTRPIEFDDLQRVLDRVTRQLGAGWHLSLAGRFTVPAHGPLGFAVVTAPDIETAIGVLIRYLGIRGPFLWPAGSIEGTDYVIRFHESMHMGTQRRLLVELALLSVQGLIERPLGRKMRGAQLAFALAPPSYRDMLNQAFHADVVFGARRHSLRFPAAWLDEPCVLHDEAMHRYLLGRCEAELKLMSGILPAEIAVRQALLASPGRLPGLREIAAGQNLSPRTLIRRLKHGNTSYRIICNDVRRSLAIDYLANSGLSIGHIAYHLGYQDPSNFGRAFRSWFGLTPGQYRKQGGIGK
ncbi:MAG: AraC family transcriptional regulator ligand-binding domain-containing protein [Xanthomonadales bacterium]|jgi:AraC-like DNA-binding protein|nr:AraC family transcriptional regulator ligand-binding domain-containing protein [Xanthomonadales bacterium]